MSSPLTLTHVTPASPRLIFPINLQIGLHTSKLSKYQTHTHTRQLSSYAIKVEAARARHGTICNKLFARARGELRNSITANRMHAHARVAVYISTRNEIMITDRFDARPIRGRRERDESFAILFPVSRVRRRVKGAHGRRIYMCRDAYILCLYN